MPNEEKKLSKFGLVKSCKRIGNVAVISLTTGFSENATKTFDFIKVCGELFPDLPIIETCITEKDFALIVLTEKK